MMALIMQRRSFLAAPLVAAYPLAAAEPEPRVYAFGDGIPHTPAEYAQLESAYAAHPVKEYASLFDTVYISMYKYLNAASDGGARGFRSGWLRWVSPRVPARRRRRRVPRLRG